MDFGSMIENDDFVTEFQEWLLNENEINDAGIEQLRFCILCKELLDKSATSPASLSTTTIDQEHKWNSNVIRIARVIYRNYVRPNHMGCSVPLSVTSRRGIRNAVKEGLNNNSTNERIIDVTSFQRAYQEVALNLKSNYLPRFLISNNKLKGCKNSLNDYDKTSDLSDSISSSLTTTTSTTTTTTTISISTTNNHIHSNNKEEFDIQTFHEMLTEKLNQLKVSKDNSELKDQYKNLESKTKNPILLKLIDKYDPIEVDIEEDAMMALDNQFDKIGDWYDTSNKMKNNTINLESVSNIKFRNTITSQTEYWKSSSSTTDFYSRNVTLTTPFICDYK